MIGESFLAFYSSVGGGAIGNMLFRWEQAGVFSYVLPFLLIFAIVFGILEKTNFFGSKDKTNKGINVVIAMAIGFMALQFNFVSVFFSEIFPRFGIGLSILLVVLIFLGLFINPKNKGWTYGLTGIAIIIVAFVVIGSLDSYNWYVGSGFGYWWSNNWPILIGVLAFIGLFIGIIAGTGEGKGDANPEDSLLGKMLLGK